MGGCRVKNRLMHKVAISFLFFLAREQTIRRRASSGVVAAHMHFGSNKVEEETAPPSTQC